MCCISTHSTSSFVIPRGIHYKKYHSTFISPALSLHCWIALLDHIIALLDRELATIINMPSHLNQIVSPDQEINLICLAIVRLWFDTVINHDHCNCIIIDAIHTTFINGQKYYWLFMHWNKAFDRKLL